MPKNTTGDETTRSQDAGMLSANWKLSVNV